MKNEKRKMIWMPVCMSIGIGLGMAFGAPAGQLQIGLTIGIGFGLAVGGIMDRIANADKGRNS